MFLKRINKTNAGILVYNYKADAFILAFMNANAAESFEKAEEVRRILAKSVFVFNENNHLQLTVSQCVSEKSAVTQTLRRFWYEPKKTCKRLAGLRVILRLRLNICQRVI